LQVFFVLFILPAVASMKKLHPNLVKITRLLSDGGYHSGDELGQTLAITRSAVWKVIKKLQQCGVKIHSAKGKGYALAEAISLLDKQQIKKQLLPAHRAAVDIQVFASVTSTNDYLKTHPEPRHLIKICVTETQTQGRGRFKSQWYSPFGKNIYFSCRYSFQKDIAELTGLNLVVSLAVLKTVQQCGVVSDLSVHWPNYISWRQKKLACCLIEMNAEANGGCDAVIGIGINVNLLTTDTDFSWASMAQALGKEIDRNMVCARLINHLVPYLQQFAEQGFSSFKKEWLSHDGLMKQSISLSRPQGQVCGTVLGINDRGHLLLQTEDQCITAYSTGDSVLFL
jgi:BirA family transcriptional regulator, biotin operon repressor / biotin---[acetyl-CoA-carboxylase] ligase